MYLLNMTNADYMMMTIVFGLLAAISYWCRRKNPTSKDFLVLSSHKISPFTTLLSMASIGLPEFLLFSSVAACYGLPVICLFIPIFLVISTIYDHRTSKSRLINDVINANTSNLNQRAFYILYGLFLIFIAAVAISITVTLLKSLLGWEFGNTTLSLMAVVGVCVLLGGVLSVVFNQTLVFVAVASITSVIIFVSYKFIGFGSLIANLHNVASANNLTPTAFTKPAYTTASVHSAIYLFFIAIVLMAIYPLNYIKQNKLANKTCTKGFVARLLQLGMLVLLMFIGIFALATPNSTQTISGSKIITQQTKLQDGSMGFIVKAVPSSGDSTALQKGIIPPSMNVDDDFASKYSAAEVSSQGFDYLSAALVLIKHSLPYAFISLVIIVLLFYKTMSECLSGVTLLTINGFYAPYYNQSNEDVENLWATRVFLFMYVFVAVSLGLVLYKFFDLPYLFGVSLLFGILVSLQLLGFRLNIVANILAFLITLIGILCVKIDGVPALLPLIKFPSWEIFIICWGVLVFVVTLILAFISKVISK